MSTWSGAPLGLPLAPIGPARPRRPLPLELPGAILGYLLPADPHAVLATAYLSRHLRAKLGRSRQRLAAALAVPARSLGPQARPDLLIQLLDHATDPRYRFNSLECLIMLESLTRLLPLPCAVRMALAWLAHTKRITRHSAAPVRYHRATDPGRSMGARRFRASGRRRAGIA